MSLLSLDTNPDLSVELVNCELSVLMPPAAVVAEARLNLCASNLAISASYSVLLASAISYTIAPEKPLVPTAIGQMGGLRSRTRGRPSPSPSIQRRLLYQILRVRDGLLNAIQQRIHLVVHERLLRHGRHTLLVTHQIPLHQLGFQRGVARASA